MANIRETALLVGMLSISACSPKETQPQYTQISPQPEQQGSVLDKIDLQVQTTLPDKKDTGMNIRYKITNNTDLPLLYDPVQLSRILRDCGFNGNQFFELRFTRTKDMKPDGQNPHTAFVYFGRGYVNGYVDFTQLEYFKILEESRHPQVLTQKGKANLSTLALNQMVAYVVCAASESSSTQDPYPNQKAKEKAAKYAEEVRRKLLAKEITPAVGFRNNPQSNTVVY